MESMTGPAPDASAASGYTGGLSDKHRQMLVDSGISKAIGDARGYLEITETGQLTRAGFAPSQAQKEMLPGLLIPLWGVSGQRVGSQWRPDNPRSGSDGRLIKYETPRRMGLKFDIHPFMQPYLGDPGRPLIVTEGVRKADAAASRGWCAISVLGVWGWRGKNDHGGLCSLPDWEPIALNGRTVYICFDSDVMLNPHVHSALVRLGAFLGDRGAK